MQSQTFLSETLDHVERWQPQSDAPAPGAELGPSTSFYVTFGIIVLLAAVILFRYYRRMNADRLEVVKLLTASVMPLGLLTIVVLGVILFGITTATESAASKRAVRAGESPRRHRPRR